MMHKPEKPSRLACSHKKFVFAILIVLVLCSLFLYHSFLHSRFELPEPLRELRHFFGDGEVKSRRRPDTSEHKSPDAQSQVPGRNFPVIHVSMVICGKKLQEALMSLKVISIITRHFLHIHIFAEEELHKVLDGTIMKWPAWTGYWLQFEIYPITYPVVVDQGKWKALFKLCASQRLFLPHLLPNIDSIIYIDTDVIFVQPPETLWAHFSLFNESQLAGVAFEADSANGWYNKFASHPFYEPYGINSGVMLMNLTRIRAFSWEQKLIEIQEQYENHIPWGDQDILNIFFHSYRHFLYTLPCSWNYRPDLCMYGNTCADVQVHGLNALHGNRGAFHDTKLAEFKSLFEVAKLYKFGMNYRTFALAHIRKALMQMKQKNTRSYCHIVLNLLEAHFKES